jgi:deuterolysin
MAEMHDLSVGGTYDVRLEGALPYAALNTTTLVGSVPYKSNLLSANVDGTLAAKARKAFHAKIKRADLQNDCTGQRGAATSAALTNCADMAGRAAVAARTGPAAKMTEFFKRSDNATRQRVAAAFDRAQKECATQDAGVSDLYCTDVLKGCDPGVLAYTLPSQSLMVNCNSYFSDLPGKETKCHEDDQQLTTLHEVTHLTQVQDTEDFGTYGYNGVRSLSAGQNLVHADTYALYAAGKCYF